MTRKNPTWILCGVIDICRIFGKFTGFISIAEEDPLTSNYNVNTDFQAFADTHSCAATCAEYMY